MVQDPYLRIIYEFNKKNVKYIVIGVSGINYYASNAREIIMTGDYDIFLKPDVENVTKAVKIMLQLDYTIIAGTEKIKSLNTTKSQNIIKKGKTLVCENAYYNLIELCLEVSGYIFEELEKNVKMFKAGRNKIYVASLKDLLKMKEIADRPKDRTFLQKYSEFLKK